MSGHTRLLLMTIFVFAGPLQLLADVTGEIPGTVSDPSAAAIAGAEITTTNTATGVVQDAVSDGLGLYTIQELAVVRYVLTVNRVTYCVSSDDSEEGKWIARQK